MHTRLIPTLILWLLASAQTLADTKQGGDALARRLINSQGCKACHALEGQGGNRAASMEELAAKQAGKASPLQLAGGTGRHGDGRIPDFSHLPDASLEALTFFITNLAASGGKENP